MLTITPFLWFDTQAEEAMEGQKFIGLNGNPHFKLTDSVSFLVSCETQAQVDHLWNRLTADGGDPGRCGWLKDKFGLSWQIVPTAMRRLLSSGDGDGAASGRVMQALMQMNKIDIAGLQRAHDGH